MTVLDMYIHGGEFFEKLLQERRQRVQPDRVDRRDANIARHHVLQRLHPAGQRLEGVDDLLAVVVEQLTLLGQPKHLLAAFDQQRIEMPLERADLLAHRRLRDLVDPRRAGKAPALGQVAKNPQALDLHKLS